MVTFMVVYTQRWTHTVRYSTRIQSARHAVRVLQYADISQFDWSIEQLDLHGTNITLACVLIDFALTGQGDCYKDRHHADDYVNMADELHEAGIPADLIRKWFGPREERDFYLSSHVMDSSR
ncbi:hypothetical protein AZE42_04412 [Rhizopogon vesiculosus]|uniref:Uncharacterized protein n=1 Tax=Rhizopogon vesiculosus TaxID=180088 RepID=A0A1J8QJ85_9AGAM|nr:hypothetical protein AZE42_04412 [Rhizopogon vesiculosus]